MKAKTTLLLVTYTLFAFASCVPLGLPEHFARINEATPSPGDDRSGYSNVTPPALFDKGKKSPIIVLLENGKQSRREYLGHQFLLGIIPFTHLYFEHGIVTSASELFLESMSERALTPIIVRSARQAVRVSSMFGGIPVSRPRVSDVAVSAYDLLFVRNVRVSGDLALDDLAPSDGELLLLSTYEIPLSRTEYKIYAHAPFLSSLLHQTIKAGWSKALGARKLTTVPLPLPAVSEKQSPLLFVGSPRFSTPLSASVMKAAHHSYGFPESDATGVKSIARLAQRGIDKGLNERDIDTVVIFEDENFIRGNASVVAWYLDTSVSAVEVLELGSGSRLRLNASFRLTDVYQGRTTEVKRAFCALEVELDDSHEAYLPLGLEQAFGLMVQAFFAQQPNGQALCRATL